MGYDDRYGTVAGACIVMRAIIPVTSIPGDYRPTRLR